jgi:hypothetical protein
MTIDLEPFRGAVEELEDIRGPAAGEEFRRLSASLDEIIEPLRDGTVDEGDIERVVASWWDVLGEQEIGSARREAALHLQLADLYRRLQHASDDDIEAYLRLRMEARIRAVAGTIAAIARRG